MIWLRGRISDLEVIIEGTLLKEKYLDFIHGGSNSEPSLLPIRLVPLPFEPFQHLLKINVKLPMAQLNKAIYTIC